MASPTTSGTPSPSPATDAHVMTRHLLTGALVAGLVTGVFAAALQLFFVVPLLLEGEAYEVGSRVHFRDGLAESSAGGPGIGGDLGRHLGTLALNLVAWIGFALLMFVGFALAARSGHAVDARRGLIWGLCGFVAVVLAPAAGLPPELPGTVGPELQARQIWWTLTVAASVAGLAAIAFGHGPVPVIAGATLLALPQVIGAPRLDTYFGVAPPELAAHFATMALAVSAAVWAALGGVGGWLWARPG